MFDCTILSYTLLHSEDLSLAWRGGVVALAEARLLQASPTLPAIFLPNCPNTGAMLAGDWNVTAPLIGGEHMAKYCYSKFLFEVFTKNLYRKLQTMYTHCAPIG